MGKTDSPSRNPVRPRKKLRIAIKAIKVLRNTIEGTLENIWNIGRRDCIPIHNSPLTIKISASEERAINRMLVELPTLLSKFSCSSLITRDSVALAPHFKVHVAERKRKLAGSSTAIFTAPLAGCQSRAGKQWRYK